MTPAQIKRNTDGDVICSKCKTTFVSPATDRCPKHKIKMMLRQNAKTGDIALACPMCDVEARGNDRDMKLISDLLKKKPH